jgi:D-threo-aldose 1-dehydrogenase
MTNRRNFLTSTILGGASLAALPLASSLSRLANAAPERNHYLIPHTFGLGGVAAGNGGTQTSDEDALAALELSWQNGVRYFDTSPFYGYGLSERRFGSFLDNKPRDQYVISTKVGRIFRPSAKPPEGIWVNPSHFDFTYDYTASGVRRSIEDSLQRLGVERIDVAFIHDLSPDNKDFKGEWLKHFEVARKGAMKELTKMRSEGLIKGWGLGVNEIDPILKTLDVADPDVFLSANQYSLLKHEDALNRLFPACEKRNVKLVIGTPLNAGCLAGADRFNWDGKFPEEMKAKREKLREVAKTHKVDLRTAALQFSKAPDVVCAIIPGARNGKQAEENAKSMTVKIPQDFWKDLKDKKLIDERAQLPKA